jgi:hypothetical protein
VVSFFRRRHAVVASPTPARPRLGLLQREEPGCRASSGTAITRSLVARKPGWLIDSARPRLPDCPPVSSILSHRTSIAQELRVAARPERRRGGIRSGPEIVTVFLSLPIPRPENRDRPNKRLDAQRKPRLARRPFPPLSLPIWRQCRYQPDFTACARPDCAHPGGWLGAPAVRGEHRRHSHRGGRATRSSHGHNAPRFAMPLLRGRGGASRSISIQYWPPPSFSSDDGELRSPRTEPAGCRRFKAACRVDVIVRVRR